MACGKEGERRYLIATGKGGRRGGGGGGGVAAYDLFMGLHTRQPRWKKEGEGEGDFGLHAKRGREKGKGIACRKGRGLLCKGGRLVRRKEGSREPYVPFPPCCAALITYSSKNKKFRQSAALLRASRGVESGEKKSRLDSRKYVAIFPKRTLGRRKLGDFDCPPLLNSPASAEGRPPPPPPPRKLIPPNAENWPSGVPTTVGWLAPKALLIPSLQEMLNMRNSRRRHFSRWLSRRGGRKRRLLSPPNVEGENFRCLLSIFLLFFRRISTSLFPYASGSSFWGAWEIGACRPCMHFP